MRHVRTLVALAPLFRNTRLFMSASSGFKVRVAASADLPTIHSLIKDSFAALNDHTPPEFHARIQESAESLCKNELTEPKFHETYFTTYGTCFWVVEDVGNQEVLGCVAVKRVSQDLAELVRMAVSPTCRSQGLGKLLIDELVSYCAANGVLQIFLTTGNPRSGAFYKKHGFVNLYEPDSRLMKMFKYLGERVITRVAIVGGTHGNERVGVELVRQWADAGHAVRRDRTFEVAAVVGNPAAVSVNRRYVDKDLNRQFLGATVATVVGTTSVEEARARELDALLGPKGPAVDDVSVGVSDAAPLPAGVDFVIDLHSSNANVGLVAMASALDVDYVATRLAHHLLHDPTVQARFPGLKVTSAGSDKAASWSVDSASPYGVSFEVGPLVHGTLSSTMLEATRGLVEATLDFLDARNRALLAAGPPTRWGRRTVVLASASPQAAELICRPGPTPEFDCYTSVAKMEYPPVADGGGDTPYVLHPSLEGKDWNGEALAEGVPAFVSTDGALTVVPYARPRIPWMGFGPPTGPDGTDACTLYPLFIGEQAYVEGNTAFALYKKVQKRVF